MDSSYVFKHLFKKLNIEIILEEQIQNNVLNRHFVLVEIPARSAFLFLVMISVHIDFATCAMNGGKK